jgi:hypothetical protein
VAPHNHSGRRSRGRPRLGEHCVEVLTGRRAKLNDNVSCIRDLRRKRLSPAGRALLEEMDAAIRLSQHGGPAPPSEELLERMLELPLSDRRELAEILGKAAIALRNPLPATGQLESPTEPDNPTIGPANPPKDILWD